MLQDVFDHVGKGVREDGYDALVFSSQDVLSVATVLGKHGGSPSLGALSGDESKALKQIIRSGGAAPVPNLAINLRGGDKLLDFVLHDGFSWFLWAEQRLQPSKRNAQTLRCYHNNTVRSLLQAWLLQEFLAEATRIDPWGAVLTDLVKRAMRLLAIPTYKNLSTIAFLERKDFQAVRAEVQKRL